MKNGLTRLTEPMVRDNGGLRTATWDEALDRAAAGSAGGHRAEPRLAGSACSAARRPRTR